MANRASGRSVVNSVFLPLHSSTSRSVNIASRILTTLCKWCFLAGKPVRSTHIDPYACALVRRWRLLIRSAVWRRFARGGLQSIVPSTLVSRGEHVSLLGSGIARVTASRSCQRRFTALGSLELPTTRRNGTSFRTAVEGAIALILKPIRALRCGGLMTFPADTPCLRLIRAGQGCSTFMRSP